MPQITCPHCHEDAFAFSGWVGVHHCPGCGARLVVPVEDSDRRFVHTFGEGFRHERRLDPRQTVGTR